ncbi:hypothetical protein EMCRGX_G016696 [Ephydatia muelleri]
MQRGCRLRRLQTHILILPLPPLADQKMMGGRVTSVFGFGAAPNDGCRGTLEREGRVLTSLNSKKTGRLWNTELMEIYKGETKRAPTSCSRLSSSC